jgi:DNA-binding transcriptional LysR family regulator
MLIDTLFARCEIAPSVVAECDSLEVVRALVAAGFGYALLPRECLRPGEPGIDVLEVAEPLPRLPVAALVLRAREQPPAVRAFLEALNAR